MRLLLFASCAALLSACASSKPSPVFRAPSLAPITTAVSKAQGHVGKARTHADKAKAAVADARREAPDDRPALTLALGTAQTEIDALTLELGFTQEALKSSQTAVGTLHGELSTLVDQANRVAHEREQFRNQRDVAVKKYHRAKKYGALAIGLIGLALGGFLMKFIPSPYNFIALGLGPLAGLGWYMFL